ncbi:reverse transcriptase domain-containing protein [Tanacetum coccineum]
MTPKKRTTRTSPATTTTTTTPITKDQLKVLIAQGVTDVLAERDATRSRNGEDSHDSGTGTRRAEQAARECTYSDFLKCQPMNFKGTEGVEISLTWWNSHVKIITHDVAYAMTWKTLKKMMTDKYCPRGEIKKLEIKMWNLKVKGTDVVGYNQRFQELALMCDRMFPEELDMIEKYVGGLLDMIHRSVMLRTRGNLITTTKQQLPKRQNVAQDYAAGTGERKEYAGTLPTITCYECGNQGHYRSDCPKLENRNHGNQAKGTEARGMVYALGGGETNQDLDDMEDDINA